MKTASPLDILRLPAPEAAPLLIGAILSANGRSGRIVEVEAYTEDDPASHSYGGKRRRNASMFLAAGHLYIYRSYGVHWCANLVTGPEGSGQAVLLRAVEPLTGLPRMRAERPGVPDHRLCAGPGNVCASFSFSGSHDGLRLGNGFDLRLGGPSEVWVGPRIGISRATDLPRRFFDPHSPALSRRSGRSSRPLEPDLALFWAKLKKVRTIS